MKNLLPFLALTAPAFGCDNPFGYSYLTETLAPGRTEIVQWVTARLGRDVGAGYDARYRGFDLKTEYEIGLSPTEQLSFYFNNRYLDSSVREGLRFDGYQIAYMRMHAHPDKHAWGQAIYLDPGLQGTVISHLLVAYDTATKQFHPQDVDDIQLSPQIIADLLAWVSEHIIDFFVLTLQNAKGLEARYKVLAEQKADSVSTTDGSKG
jgi:hypothetical protein